MPCHIPTNQVNVHLEQTSDDNLRAQGTVWFANIQGINTLFIYLGV